MQLLVIRAYLRISIFDRKRDQTSIIFYREIKNIEIKIKILEIKIHPVREEEIIKTTIKNELESLDKTIINLLFLKFLKPLNMPYRSCVFTFRQARFLSRCSQGNESCKIFPVRQSIRQPDGIFVYPIHKLVPSSKMQRQNDRRDSIYY